MRPRLSSAAGLAQKDVQDLVQMFSWGTCFSEWTILITLLHSCEIKHNLMLHKYCRYVPLFSDNKRCDCKSNQIPQIQLHLLKGYIRRGHQSLSKSHEIRTKARRHKETICLQEALNWYNNLVYFTGFFCAFPFYAKLGPKLYRIIDQVEILNHCVFSFNGLFDNTR